MCVCGHPDSSHFENAGRCNGQCYDPDYGMWNCLCYAFDDENSDENNQKSAQNRSPATEKEPI